jgi:hypothetical protein
LINNYGLGRTDHYWICPGNQDLKWKDINFFDNKFAFEDSDLFIGDYSGNKKNNEISPDRVSGGNLPKKWIIQEGKRYLL